MKHLTLMIVATVLLTLNGCARSTGYKKDQNFYRPESAGYYQRGDAKKGGAGGLEKLGQPKKRVVVLDFWNDTPVKGGDLGKFAADELRRGLFATQRVIVPTDVASDHRTEEFIQGDQVKVAQLIREGRRMGISVIGIGRVTKVVFRQKGDDIGLFRQKHAQSAVDVEVKLFDVSAGREIMAVGKSGEASSTAMVAFEDENMTGAGYRLELSKLAVREASQKLVGDVIKAVEKMNWEGHIAKISSGKVYVNAGKASGLVVGDILKVIAMGDDIYDPKSGAYLGRTQGQLKGTLEVEDFVGTDGAVTRVHTGGNYQEGDVVQLY